MIISLVFLSFLFQFRFFFIAHHPVYILLSSYTFHVFVVKLFSLLQCNVSRKRSFVVPNKVKWNEMTLFPKHADITYLLTKYITFELLFYGAIGQESVCITRKKGILQVSNNTNDSRTNPLWHWKDIK